MTKKILLNFNDYLFFLLLILDFFMAWTILKKIFGLVIYNTFYVLPNPQGQIHLVYSVPDFLKSLWFIIFGDLLILFVSLLSYNLLIHPKYAKGRFLRALISFLLLALPFWFFNH